ncbi:MAG: glycoside hydrolase family 13 protein [Clostridia bacterium]|nr:glycoside hydrolase family 13 protein [Clostridia bacterium]
MSFYNPFEREYKSTIGAIAQGENLVLRIKKPDVADRAYLQIRHDNDKYFYALKGIDDGKFFKFDISLNKTGIYFYYFEVIYPDNGKQYISLGRYHQGELSDSVNFFQLGVYDKNMQVPKLQGKIIYQIFPDRFKNSKIPKYNVPSDRIIHKSTDEEPVWELQNGKMLNNDYYAGDLKGIEQSIPYLKTLNVGIIYLNPIFESHTNHRYDTADYLKIDPLLGTKEDFISLCNAAHKNEIKIILDGVFNHTGADSVYFNKFNRYENIGAYQSKESKYYPWFKFINWPDEYSSWWGFKSLPDLNETNADFIEFICGKNGVIETWMNAGADGFRLDVADELPDEFLRRFRQKVKSINRDALIIGEVWEDASNKISYNERKQYLWGDELDSVMNYPFRQAILDFIINDDVEEAVYKINNIIDHYPKKILDILMNPLGTHDTVRIATELSGRKADLNNRDEQANIVLTEKEKNLAIKRLRLAFTISYTLPGIPAIYYGDETPMFGYRDPFNRKPFEKPSNDNLLYNHLIFLGNLRKNFSCFEKGILSIISAADGCISYLREDEKNTVVLIANRAENKIVYHLSEKYRDYEVIVGEKQDKDNIIVNPIDFVILSKQK